MEAEKRSPGFLIDSLVDTEKSLGLVSMVGSFFNVNSLKNTGLISKLKYVVVEIPKE